MSGLKTVKLSEIHPNPFRALEDWPTIREKVEEIKASLADTGFWNGYMLVRPRKGGGYEQAFGHHRVVAAKELWGEDARITVTVDDIDDERMLKIMAQENSEAYGQRFYYAVMQPIAAVVKAHADRPHLAPLSPHTKPETVRYAPSFALAPREGQEEKAYTAASIADFFGWVKGGSGRALDKVNIAVSALELIEKKAVKAHDLVSLNQAGVARLVEIHRKVTKSVVEAVDKDVAIHEAAEKLAKKQDDEKRAREARAKIEALEARAQREAAKRAAEAAKAAAAVLNESDREADRQAIEAAGFEVEEVRRKKAGSGLSAADKAQRYLTSVEAFFREDASGWAAALDYAGHNKRYSEKLAAAIQGCVERGRNRKKEVER